MLGTGWAATSLQRSWSSSRQQLVGLPGREGRRAWLSWQAGGIWGWWPWQPHTEGTGTHHPGPPHGDVVGPGPAAGGWEIFQPEELGCG